MGQSFTGLSHTNSCSHLCLSVYTMGMYYVYVLQNIDKGLYFGSTNDLRRRLAEHNAGQSRYTRGKQWKLVYYESYLDETDARLREKRLKLQGQAMVQLKRRIHRSLNKS